MTKKLNPYPRPQRGSGFYDFLKEDGIFEEVQVHAIKQVLVEQFDDAMHKSNLTKLATAQPLELDK